MPPRLLISDVNILIDVEVGELVEPMFKLDYEFAVPDVLYEEELAAQHGHLRELGLLVMELSGPTMAEVAGMAERYDSVSRNDLMALGLARQERCPLLTGDRHLRGVSEQEAVEVHGTLWLVEEMVAAGLLSADDAKEAYGRMRQEGRRLPWREIEHQLDRLCREGR